MFACMSSPSDFVFCIFFEEGLRDCELRKETSRCREYDPVIVKICIVMIESNFIINIYER